MDLQFVSRISNKAIGTSKLITQVVWVKFISAISNILIFWAYNPIHLICSIIYYIISSLLLGGSVSDFIHVLLIYLISIAIAFSSLGERFLRLIHHVRPLETKRETEYILPLFQDVCQCAKESGKYLGQIEICIIDNMTVNAMAIGRHTIAVTKGAIETFSEDELKSVIAHEIAHIFHGDTMAALYAVIGNGIFTAYILFYKFVLLLIDIAQNSIFGKNNIINLILVVIKFVFNFLICLFSFIMQIAIAINSRICEYRADKFAYDIGYDHEMIEVLYLLEKISLGDNSNIIQKMLASHPRVTLRIKKLEELDEQSEEYVPLIP